MYHHNMLDPVKHLVQTGRLIGLAILDIIFKNFAIS